MVNAPLTLSQAGWSTRLRKTVNFGVGLWKDVYRLLHGAPCVMRLLARTAG